MLLTTDERFRLARLEAQIADRAERGGPWPVRFGPVAQDRRVYDALMQKAHAVGWDAELREDDTLVIVVRGPLGGPNGYA